MRWLAIWAAILVLVAFGPAIAGPFAFDDEASVVHNSSIHDIEHPWRWLSPPGGGSPVSGRPAVNVSFALNFAVDRALGLAPSGSDATSFEAASDRIVNILLHLGVGLLLFGVIRRTLRTPRVPESLSSRADLVAAVIASIFLVHPIQTEAVDYISQRTELLASLCYLGVMYCAIRTWASGTRDSEPGSARDRAATQWFAAAVVISIVGMASKEMMVTVPVAVMLFDRAFLLESWHEALVAPVCGPRRAWLYIALFATTLVAIGLVLAGGRGETVALSGSLTWSRYVYSQGWAIWRYLALLLWPSALTFDYGRQAITGVAPGVGIVAILGLFVGIAMAWAKPSLRWLAFLGTWFFLLIAPSSSIVPVQTEIAAERRVYLAVAAPIAAVVVAVVLLVDRRNRASARTNVRDRRLPASAALVVLLLTVVSFNRSAMYRSPEALWEDASLKMPGNARAIDNLAALDLRATPPRIVEAESLLERAIALDSTNVRPWTRLAGIKIHADQLAKAEAVLRHALELAPRDSEAIDKMGQVFLASGRPDSAAKYLERITQRSPTSQSLTNLGSAYLESDQYAPAVSTLRRSLAMDSTATQALVFLGGALVEMDSGASAVAVMERAVALEPDHPFDLALLSVAYAEAGRVNDASAAAANAVQRAPTEPSILVFAGRAMLRAGKAADGERYLSRAVQAAPNDPQAVTRYAMARAAIGDRTGADAVLRRVLTAVPGYPLAERVRDSLRLRD